MYASFVMFDSVVIEYSIRLHIGTITTDRLNAAGVIPSRPSSSYVKKMTFEISLYVDIVLF